MSRPCPCDCIEQSLATEPKRYQRRCHQRPFQVKSVTILRSYKEV